VRTFAADTATIGAAAAAAHRLLWHQQLQLVLKLQPQQQLLQVWL
jgi:hypothetical protein